MRDLLAVGDALAQIRAGRVEIKGSMVDPLYGLTLMKPWVWMMQHPKPPKRVENRGWSPPKGALHRYIAIHAGKGRDEEALSYFRRLPFMPRPYLSTIDRPEIPEVPDFAQMQESVIVALARVPFSVLMPTQLRSEQRFWMAGPPKVGWFLDPFIDLPEPVPHRGSRGLWPVESDALQAIAAQLEAIHP